MEDGLFSPHTAPDKEDLQGAYVFPGLIDIHFHGCRGADFADIDASGLRRIAAFLLESGTTSFSIASISMPEEDLKRSYCEARRFAELAPRDCAQLLGITMEGPFFSRAKRGAHDSAHLRPPDAGLVLRLDQYAGGLVKIVCVAPELEGAPEMIQALRSRYRIALAHTNADYDTAARAFDCGAVHLTHLFNAMPPIGHRSPGVIPAAAERENVMVELICDGVHVHPSAVRLAFRLFGAQRICLITDAISPCGMPDGEYTLGNQTVTLRDGRITLPDGTLAGSGSTMLSCVRSAVQFGIPLEDAVRCASWNPAVALGVQHIVGSIAPGKRADCIVCDEQLHIKRVYRAGERVL